MHKINVTVPEILPNDYVLLGGVLYRVFSAGPHRVFEDSTKVSLMDDDMVGFKADDIVDIIFKNNVRLDILRTRR